VSTVSHDTFLGWQAFQARRGLVVDGVPGPATLAAVIELESRQDTTPVLGRWRFSAASLKRMVGVHPDLVAVAHYALRVSPIDFLVTPTGGVRSQTQQLELVRKGVSRTTRSRHLTGHAIDVVSWKKGKASWTLPDALLVHQAFADASRALSVPLRWGGDWDGDGDWKDERFLDAFHHELPYSVYGDDRASLSPAAAEFLRELSP
jgi:peptidoglycan L-alanyl-D-glutamate endopeptidase CwlK